MVKHYPGQHLGYMAFARFLYFWFDANLPEFSRLLRYIDLPGNFDDSDL